MAQHRSIDFLQRIRAGEFILMDGALGTELERRGVPIDGAGWSALAVRDHGAIVRQTHEDYIRAGAKLHIVNSFALARHVLEPIGLGEEFEALNRRAVALFDEAVAGTQSDRDALWVAGSLSTFAANSDRTLLPRGDALTSNYRDQARVLLDAGVDLFALEMLFDRTVSLSMLEAAQGFGVPIILGFTCSWGQDGGARVTTAQGMGSPVEPFDAVLPAVIDAIESEDVILSIMHSAADVTDAALEILHRYWDGPVAVYPNSGHFIDLRMQFDSVCSASEFQQSARRWIDSGARIVGGCCGIGPAHIRRLNLEPSS
ncbi:MAG: homocysteine S-methyltransferase family protein [Gammaproteobacteria bacterium]|nr:homocysteine S-methyltransferase family protein [Gammaproteobacteria bacterium]MDH3446949.1 homocysteine S-methyltransferase family protein [Gammaproteobacteria bacterium]